MTNNSPLDTARDQIRDLLEMTCDMGGTADDVYRVLLKGQRQGNVSDEQQEAMVTRLQH